jgi:hypothetical protein
LKLKKLRILQRNSTRETYNSFKLENLVEESFEVSFHEKRNPSLVLYVSYKHEPTQINMIGEILLYVISNVKAKISLFSRENIGSLVRMTFKYSLYVFLPNMYLIRVR